MDDAGQKETLFNLIILAAPSLTAHTRRGSEEDLADDLFGNLETGLGSLIETLWHRARGENHKPRSRQGQKVKVANTPYLGGRLFFSLNLFAFRNLLHVSRFNGIDTATKHGPPT